MPQERIVGQDDGHAEHAVAVPERTTSPLPISSSFDSAHTHSSNPSRSLSQHLSHSQDGSPARLASTSVIAVARAVDTTVAVDEGVGHDGDNDSATASMSAALPSNDGMKDLRRQLHDIREMALSSEEKASRMHALMNAEFEHFRASHMVHESILKDSPGLLPDEALDSITASARLRSPSPISVDSLQDTSNPYAISDGDLEESHCPPSPVSEHGDDSPLEPSDSHPELGCQHYKRNVKVQCRDCRRWYPCRLCHDEEVKDHQLERKRIENMLCMFCKTPQLADEYCKNCGALTAAYFCRICKLWDNDARRRIYHCDDCGICRLGEGLGKDYIHCKKCNVCISIAHAERHRCVERATECDCPICGDYMFASAASVVAMQCGHYIHRACYDAYMQSSYRCPICNRSAVNMELQWRKLDHAIEAQPMPEQYRTTRVWITCNDCTGRTCVPYHWLGNKCTECDSYNTNEIKILDVPQQESGTEEQHHHHEYEQVQREVAPSSRPARVSFSQHIPRPRAYSNLGNSPSTTGTTNVASQASTASNFGLEAGDTHAQWTSSAARSSDDDNDDSDDMSFWGGDTASSAWNASMSPLSEGGRFLSRPRSWGSPRFLAGSVLSRTRSLDAAPQSSRDAAEDMPAEGLEQNASRGWSIGPGWLTSRLQRSSRDAPTMPQNDTEGAGWLSSAGWTSPTFLAQRFGRGTSISEAGILDGSSEENDDDEGSSDEERGLEDQDEPTGAEDDFEDDTFGLPGHL